MPVRAKRDTPNAELIMPSSERRAAAAVASLLRRFRCRGGHLVVHVWVVVGGVVGVVVMMVVMHLMGHWSGGRRGGLLRNGVTG